jgi:hypothetical protein
MSTAAAVAIAAAVEPCFAAVLSLKKAPSAWEGMEACHSSYSNVNFSNVNFSNASGSNGSGSNGQSGRKIKAMSAAAAASADPAVSVLFMLSFCMQALNGFSNSVKDCSYDTCTLLCMHSYSWPVRYV